MARSSIAAVETIVGRRSMGLVGLIARSQIEARRSGPHLREVGVGTILPTLSKARADRVRASRQQVRDLDRREARKSPKNFLQARKVESRRDPLMRVLAENALRRTTLC